jgi:predicted RNase H-like nuclease (RuvC/YqgF family)
MPLNIILYKRVVKKEKNHMNCTMQATLELLDKKLEALEEGVKGLRSEADELKKLSGEIHHVMDEAYKSFDEIMKRRTSSVPKNIDTKKLSDKIHHLRDVIDEVKSFNEALERSKIKYSIFKNADIKISPLPR